MNRDELLTKLAMELAEWPVDCRQARRAMPAVVWFEIGTTTLAAPDDGREGITEQHWLDERARLINKPSWDTVPKFLGWIAQDSDARWYGYRDKPRATKNLWFGGKPDVLSMGKIPAGHDWRATLEKRPASEDLMEPEWEEGDWPPPINKACEYRCGEGSEWRQGTCVGYYNGYAVVVDEEDDTNVQMVEHVRPPRTAEQREEEALAQRISDFYASKAPEEYLCLARELIRDGYRKEIEI